MLRRNRYLTQVEWFDGKGRQNGGRGRKRRGRKWWNPLVDGPILTLNIDEAHEFLAFKASPVSSQSRRACTASVGSGSGLPRTPRC